MINSSRALRSGRWVSFGLGLLGVFCATLAWAKEPAPVRDDLPGIVGERPTEGPAVAVEGGFMVPYTQTIPGSDVAFEMVPVPGGEFLLGSPADEAGRGPDEGPQVKVKVEPFWIGKRELTWAEYKSFMAMYDAFKKLQRLAGNRAAAGGDAAATADDWKLIERHAWSGDVAAEWGVDAVTSATPLYDPSFTFTAGEKPNQPAVTMTQYAAKQYTKWLSGLTGQDFRLPSEAEWEYAARAGTTTPYSFGDDVARLAECAWTAENSEDETHAVGEKAPNAWGLFDVHGNVAEWTLDEYAPDAYAGLGKGPVDAASAIRWPTKVYPRVIRGGSWLDEAASVRSAARHKSDDEEWKLSDPNIPLSPWWYTEEPATGVGMRIIRPLRPMTPAEKERVWEADVDDLRQDVQDRLREGRGVLGVADRTLPAAVEAAEKIDGEGQ